MIHKFAVFISVILSASCMVLHQAQGPLHGFQYNSNPSYNFAYEVNEAHTGDVRSQHESRRGDNVLGQYSLVQPNGIQRTVDYRADDHSGFRATVNHQGRNPNAYPVNFSGNNGAITRHSNLAASLANVGAVQSYQGYPTSVAAQPASSTAYSPVHQPVAVSTSSFVQTISHGPALSPHNGHNNLWA